MQRRCHGSSNYSPGARSPQAKVAEKLIILLHCDMVSTEIQPRKSKSNGTGARGEDMDWALLAALKVAEGGKTLGERRIGEFVGRHSKIGLRMPWEE